MGTRGEALATRFEAKAAELTAAIEGLSEAEWKKVTTAEQWSVGVTAHHAAGGHEQIANLVKTVAAGRSVPNLTLDMLHEMNAKHSREFAHCTKAETLELHKRGVAAASAIIRALSDAELDRTGAVLSGRPPITAQQAIEGILINHMQEHLASIQATVAR